MTPELKAAILRRCEWTPKGCAIHDSATHDLGVIITDLLQIIEKQTDALFGVERFVRVAGESSHNIVYERACLEHANECAELLTETSEALKRLAGEK